MTELTILGQLSAEDLERYRYAEAVKDLGKSWRDEDALEASIKARVEFHRLRGELLDRYEIPEDLRVKIDLARGYIFEDENPFDD